MTDLRILTSENASEECLDLQSESHRAARAFLPLVCSGTRDYISNVQAEMQILLLDDLALPVTINDREPANSYVCSPLCQYGLYPQEELVNLPGRVQRVLFLPLLKCLSLYLKWSSIDRVVHLNNWLVSTNLYPEMSPDQFAEIHRYALATYPKHAIVWRSINPRNHSHLIETGDSLGYDQIASRRIYFQDARTRRPFRNSAYKVDRKLFAKHGYTLRQVTNPSAETVERIVELYRMLYVDKYSKWNPQFTGRLIARLIEHDFLNCYVLEKADGRIDGVIGYYILGGIMTTPLLGYDMTIPQEVGLYRMLSNVLIDHGRDRGVLQNASAGAGHFKRSRGGEAENEYSLVYTRHLSMRRRAAWKVIQQLANRVALPLVIKHGL